MTRLLALLCRQFGLRWKRLPMAVRNRSPFSPTAPFQVVQRDGLPMIELRSQRRCA
jgi:hypothetical protein